MQSQTSFKIILVGESGVGKSCIIQRYIKDEFDETSPPTIGVGYETKNIEIPDMDGMNAKLAIWDTAGQEKYRTMTVQFYRNVSGVILVYDISKRETFDALQIWINDLKAKVGSDVMGLTMIVGNKIDKRESDEDKSSFVTKDEGADFAAQNKAMFVETSAKNGTNVANAFEELVNRLAHDNMPKTQETGVNIEKEAANNDNEGWGCC